MFRRDKNKEEVIATFDHLENVQIGKNNFSNEDLENYFGARGVVLNSNKSAIILLKQVFQKEYPITRLPNDKSLPRVPTKAEEKSKLMECMTKYFNRLRSKIIYNKFKTGDSASLREMLSELQSIKVLIEHFEETKETFPYHMFADYLSNADFINLKGDINSQMRGLQSNKVQDERIRNLLRQFTITYLKNNKSRKFILKDPGVSENQYNDEKFNVADPPPILEDLLAFINEKNTTFRNNQSYNEDITPYLEEMRKNIDELKQKRDSIDIPSGGGSDTINELEDIKISYNKLFDSMYDKYNDLLTIYNSVKTPEQCQKDLDAVKKTLEEERAEIANLKVEQQELYTVKSNLEEKIRELRGRNKEKKEKISSVSTELGLLLAELAACNAEIADLRNIANTNQNVKDSAETASGLTEEVLKLTAALEIAKQNSDTNKISELEGQRQEIQARADLALTQLSNQKEQRYRTIVSIIRYKQQRYDNMIAEKDREIESVKASAAQTEASIASLRISLTDQSISQDQLVTRLRDELTAASASLTEATASAAKDASDARANLQAAKEEARLAGVKVEELQRNLSELEGERSREVINLTGEKANIMRELEEVRSQTRIAEARAAEEAAKQKEANQAEIERITIENAQTVKSINDANKAKIDELKESMMRSEAEIRAAAEGAIDYLERIHETALQKLRDTIESQDATIAGLKTTYSEDIERLHKRITELEGEGVKAINDLEAAKAELSATKAKIDELTPKYEQLQATNEDVQNKLEACEKSLLTKTQDTIRLEDRINNLQRDIGRAEAALEDAVQRERASSNKSQLEISASKREVAAARQKLTEAEQRVSALQGESERKSKEIVSIRKENEKVVKEKDAALVASRRSAAEAEQRKAEAIAEIATLTALQNSAQRREEEARAATRAALEAVTIAEVRASQAERRASDAEDRTSEAEERTSQAEERASQLDKRASESNSRVSQAEERARAQEALVIATKAEVNLANQKTAAAEAARRAAEDKLGASEEEARRSQQAAKEAEAKVIVAEKEKREADNRLSQARFDLQFANERADNAERRADKSDQRVKKYVSRAIESEKGRREAEIALSRAKEAEQTAVEARSAAESARNEAIKRAENAERNAKKALEETRDSKVRQEKLIEIKSKIVGLEKEVETLRTNVIELDQRIVDANEEIKGQQELINKLRKGNKTVFGRLQDGVDSIGTYLGIGGKKDTLLEYCNKVAEDSLSTFLLEEPLPFFSLIKDFEKGSKLDIFKTTNEEYILKLFIKHHLEEHFNSKEMKEFYFHAKEIFGKQDCSEYAKMFFVLNEIINVIRSSNDDIDVVRIKSKEYNSSFDYLEYILQDYEYDFYSVAKKKFVLDDSDLKVFNLTFIKENIYISVNKGSKTYDFNKNLTLTRKDFDFKSDIYYISSHIIYLFFILSTHFYLQSENMIDTDEYFTVNNNLEKTVRKLKRTKNKEKKSIAKLFKERKEFKLDG